jgi:hypothetical protein
MPTGTHGPTRIFRANRTPFSRKAYAWSRKELVDVVPPVATSRGGTVRQKVERKEQEKAGAQRARPVRWDGPVHSADSNESVRQIAAKYGVR